MPSFSSYPVRWYSERHMISKYGSVLECASWLARTRRLAQKADLSFCCPFIFGAGARGGCSHSGYILEVTGCCPGQMSLLQILCKFWGQSLMEAVWTGMRAEDEATHHWFRCRVYSCCPTPAQIQGVVVPTMSGLFLGNTVFQSRHKGSCSHCMGQKEKSKDCVVWFMAWRSLITGHISLENLFFERQFWHV